MSSIDKTPSRLNVVRGDIGKAYMDLQELKFTIQDTMKERQLQSYPRVDLRTSHSLWLGSHRTKVPSEDIIPVLSNDNNAYLAADILFQIVLSWVASFVVVSFMRQSSVKQITMEFQSESSEIGPDTEMKFDIPQSNYVHSFVNNVKKPRADETDIKDNSPEIKVIYEHHYDLPQPTVPLNHHVRRRKKGGCRKQKFE